MDEGEFNENADEQGGDNLESELDPDNPEHAFTLLEREFTQVL